MKKFLFSAVALCFSLSYAQFDDDEWADFDYKHAGLTQIEFQNVKESGMTKEKLMYLLEIGIRPSVYLKEPWKDLGVSEGEWIKARSEGMEDGDIDRTYKKQTGSQSMAYLSFLVPSLYQWYTDDMAFAIAMDITWVAAVGLTVFLATSSNDASKLWVYSLGLVGAVHLWSGVDALLSTQWENNPDVKNFSWGIIPTGKGIAGVAAFRF